MIQSTANLPDVTKVDDDYWSEILGLNTAAAWIDKTKICLLFKPASHLFLRSSTERVNFLNLLMIFFYPGFSPKVD